MHTFRRHVNYSRVAYARTDIPMTYFADNAFTRVMLLLRSDKPLHMPPFMIFPPETLKKIHHLNFKNSFLHHFDKFIFFFP